MKDSERLFKKFGQTFPAGTILFREKEACTGMFIIKKGAVRIFKKVGDKEVAIDILREGEFFGEMACLIGQARSINAEVMEDSEILVIEPEVLEGLFKESSEIGLKIIGHLASRLRKAYEIIEGLIQEREEKTGAQPHEG